MRWRFGERGQSRLQDKSSLAVLTQSGQSRLQNKYSLAVLAQAGRKISGDGIMRRGYGERGQATIEYLLSTVAVLILFSSMYGFTQGQLKKLFTAAARVILTSYYKF